MVDTRCANPALQLDVDVMVLEYTLHQAIRAQFDLLTHDSKDAGKPTAEPMRILPIFDSFLRLFKHNHPAYTPSEEFEFNLDVLEFLVLLASRSSLDRSHFSDSFLDNLRTDMLNSLQNRRAWLAARERRGKQPASSVGTGSLDMARDIESQICSSWGNADPEIPRKSINSLPSDTLPLLLDLVPRFMLISHQVGCYVGLDANDTWMNIAGEFMLHASIEALQLGLERSESGAAADCLPRLEDCFAFGHGHVDDANFGGTDWETFNGLFEPPVDEQPLWTTIRLQWLSEFSIAPNASVQSQLCRLDRLARKYPITAFQDNLVQTVRDLWELFCHNDVAGKPILVQIEEGHLKSLGVEGAEFDEFMIRVGLKKDYRPVDVEAMRQMVERNAVAR